MELIRGTHNLKNHHHACVATMGGFDGVHLGHRAVLKQLQEKSKQLNLPTTVITFEPLPREYFAADKAPPRLTRLAEKLQILKQLGIDRVLCLYFNAAMSKQSAQSFADQILVQKLGIQYLLIGEAFHFGYQRQGDIDFLKRHGQANHYQAENINTLLYDDQRVSSTRIRTALRSGNMPLAEQLLARPYSISGRVAVGDARGRTIGFPTANIHLKRRSIPLEGVFAVTAIIKEDPTQACIYAVANVGTRPTVDGRHCLLEVHLLNFDRNIYGQHLHVQFRHKLRQEQRFNSLDELKTQIAKDSQAADDFFAQQA